MIEYIKNYGGTLLGTIDTDSDGNKVVRDRGGRVLGRYYKSDNTTRSRGGHIITYGDTSGGLLLKED